MEFLNSLRATALILKHLEALLPIIIAARRSVTPLRSLALVSSVARSVSDNEELLLDIYTAIELLNGKAPSVAGVLEGLIKHLEPNGKVGEAVSTLIRLGVIDEKSMDLWVIFKEVTNGST